MRPINTRALPVVILAVPEESVPDHPRSRVREGEIQRQALAYPGGHSRAEERGDLLFQHLATWAPGTEGGDVDDVSRRYIDSGKGGDLDSPLRRGRCCNHGERHDRIDGGAHVNAPEEAEAPEVP